MEEGRDYSGWHVVKFCATLTVGLCAAAAVHELDPGVLYVDDDLGPPARDASQCRHGGIFDPRTRGARCRVVNTYALAFVFALVVCASWWLLSLVGVTGGYGYARLTRHWAPSRWSTL